MPYKFRIRFMLTSLIFIVVAVWLALTVILYMLQDQLIFYPSNTIVSAPSSIGLEYEDVILHTPDDVQLHGWYIPAPNARGVILFLHGNAGNISHRLPSLEIFHSLGLSTLIVDYRGYGNSQGSPSEQGIYTDAETAWNYLIMERGYQPKDIIIFGRSLGGATAAWLAARVLPAGVILESTFTSLKTLAQKYYPYMPVGLLLRSRFSTKDSMAAINAPLLILHSRDDELVPYTHAEALHSAANNPHQLHAMKGGHDDGFLLSGDSYIQALKRFTDRVLD